MAAKAASVPRGMMFSKIDAAISNSQKDGA
jgi:hypothetical protein